ncbi:cadmium resistance transporter [Erysipelothrix anatis]|uniref:cadmium resistance transporter n=1 Tax=Erysipelothrix anatis TaxID=2683713 RepID=UPI001359F923|nr:cadmium resistance transporter [Erysipelothrix anatis]
MISIIFTGIMTYIATSIDYIVLLIILFAQQRQTGKKYQIILGTYIGMAILIGISLAGSMGVSLLPDEYIGLLGLIPLVLGIKVLLQKEDNDSDNDEEISQEYLVISTASLLLAAGADNIGVYIPLFATSSISSTTVIIIVYIVLTAFLLFVCDKVSTIEGISETVEKYEKIIVPIVFIILGIYIMIDGNIIQLILGIFG